MPGYTPWMAGAAAAAKRANHAEQARHRDAQYEDYCEYRAEARACGYEVCSFKEWLGETSLKEEAQEVYRAHRNINDACYYGDTY